MSKAHATRQGRACNEGAEGAYTLKEAMRLTVAASHSFISAGGMGRPS